MVFLVFYVFGLFGFGWIVDWFGMCVLYVVVMLVWSIVVMLYVVVGLVMGFVFVCVLFGIGEGGNFLVVIKIMVEWFLCCECVFVMGIFNLGVNIGVVFVLVIILVIVVVYGWCVVFVIIGVIGIVWFVVWLVMYCIVDMCVFVVEYDELCDEVEVFDVVNVDVGVLCWGELICKCEMWVFLVGKFLIDLVWWFYLFWLLKWFNELCGMDM